MEYKISHNIEDCRDQVKTLVEAFESGLPEFKNKKYSEAQLRIDFLNPLLKSFGWDVNNENKKTQYLRDVLQEESIDVEDDDRIAKKNPDYTLKLYGNRCLFLEAKKASIDIVNSDAAAFQTRRYGWSGNLNASILSNFEYLIVYDCRYKPSSEERSNVSRFKIFHYQDYVSNIEELYEVLSYESLESGSLNEIFPDNIKGLESFDFHFLKQIEKWRESLAHNLVFNNKNLSQEDINFLIQRLINRIIFLRICEDRDIEKFETLKQIKSYNELKALMLRSDNKYNSGLFSFIEDELTLNIKIDDDILIEIFTELYYPISSYDFSVIDPSVLSQIYEQYLGNKIELSNDYQLSIVSEPEVIASNGVVPTPKRIVKQIVEETLDPLFDTLSISEIIQLKIADICCGSGTFLIATFDYLVERIESYLIDIGDSDSSVLIQCGLNHYRLSLEEKHKLLDNNIYGVDINPYAVEVAQFSLLLKLIENENDSSIQTYLDKTTRKVLPNLNNNIKCGNSLLDNSYYEYNNTATENDDLLFKLNPFSWKDEFPFLKNTKGFDVILGNPPYVRIQNFVKYSFEEVEYYKNKFSPYSVSKKDSFDKYYLFIERALTLIKDGGKLGYIVPHKFFIVKGGMKLRKSILSQASIAKIIHFGVTQVFPDRSTYTAILILSKNKIEEFKFQRIDSLKSFEVFDSSQIVEYKNSNFGAQPWVFVSEIASILFEKVKSSNTIPLKSIAEIPVGLQTSKDPIYIFEPLEQDDTFYHFEKNGKKHKVEKVICKPCLYDISLNLFDSIQPNAQMIFPYSLIDNVAVVIPEVELKSKFPFCFDYLNIHKEELSKRSFNNKDPKWYQYGRSQSLTKFHDTEKIIFPVLSKSPSYSIDSKNSQFTGGGNGPYYSIISKSEYSIYYLLGILSHPILEAMVKSRASEFRGAYYSHGKQFIENLSIPVIDFNKEDDFIKHNDIVKIVKSLIKTKASIKTTTNYQKRTVLKRKLDEQQKKLLDRLNYLFNVSKLDIEKITGDNLFVA
tara:strand:- start:1990 stop:5049 length:3060 start_codon:yes stop_codon:yes gene_type:complete